jgi:hypothetical protein
MKDLLSVPDSSLDLYSESNNTSAIAEFCGRSESVAPHQWGPATSRANSEDEFIRFGLLVVPSCGFRDRKETERQGPGDKSAS